MDDPSVLNFPQGNYNLILSLLGQKAFRMQQNDPSKYENSKIIAALPNSQDDNQLFMIQKVGQKPHQYQIVNCLSTYVFDEDASIIRLKQGKQHFGQLFTITQAPTHNNKPCFYIKCCKGTRSLTLDYQLRYGPFYPHDQGQMFYCQQVTQNKTIINSAIFVNNMTGKVLDVPKASKKEGERIIQWQENKRWNQRWRFERRGPGVMIFSLISNLCLDVCGESKKNGAEVIQWHPTGGFNQLWIPEPCGNGLYKFQAYHEQTLHLAVREQSNCDGTEIEVCNEQNPTMYWRLDGAKP